MMNKYVTTKGKRHLLELGFLNGDNTSNFNFCALGVDGSNAAINNNEDNFKEANGDNYHRVQFKNEKTIENVDQSLVISATFDSTNYNPSEGSIINEIGIVNQDTANNNDKWFAYMSVPTIPKAEKTSLKYTVIISME